VLHERQYAEVAHLQRVLHHERLHVARS
jgi:hypothetical protein